MKRLILAIRKFVEKIEKCIEKIEKKSLPAVDGEYIFCFKRSLFVQRFSITILTIAIILSLYFILGINSGYLKWWIPVFSLAVLSLGVISSPVAVYLNNKDLEIHGLVEVTRIRISSIEHIYSLNSTYARIYILPVMTSFGFFGHNGRYYDIRHRCWVKSICSEHNNLIMIECIGKKRYLISAKNREEMIRIISESVAQKKQEMREIIERNYSK